MNVDFRVPFNRCVNCSIPYNEIQGRTTKVQEIYLQNHSYSFEHQINTPYNDYPYSLGSCQKVGQILLGLFKLNHIPSSEDEDGEDELVKINPDDLSVCLTCSQYLVELWRVYNDFIQLGGQGSFLAQRLSKLDELLEKQERYNSLAGGLIQLRSDIFEDDNSSEADDFVSITRVAEPVIRGKIPVKVLDSMPDLPLSTTQAEQSCSNQFVQGGENFQGLVNDEQGQLCQRWAFTPEIPVEQGGSGGQEKVGPLPPISEIRRNGLSSDINVLNLALEHRSSPHAVSSTLFPQYTAPMACYSEPPPAPERTCTSNGSNKRKSSVITRQYTETTSEASPHHDSNISSSSYLISPPSPLQPPILSRKRKLPDENINGSNPFNFSETVVPVLTSSTEISTRATKIPKVPSPVLAPWEEESKETKQSEEEAGRNTNATKESQIRSNSSSQKLIQHSINNDQQILDDALRDDASSPEEPTSSHKSPPLRPTDNQPKNSDDDKISAVVTTKGRKRTSRKSRKRLAKKFAGEEDSDKDTKNQFPLFKIFRSISMPTHGSAIPTIKICKTRPKAEPSDDEEHGVAQASKSCSRPYPCQYCDYKAKTTDRLKTHGVKVHGTILRDKKFNEKNTAENKYVEESAIKVEASVVKSEPVRSKNRQTRQEQDGPFPCELCSFRGLSQVGLQAHHKRNHELVRCPECERTFVDKYILQEHVRMTHDTRGASYRRKLRTRFPDPDSSGTATPESRETSEDRTKQHYTNSPESTSQMSEPYRHRATTSRKSTPQRLQLHQVEDSFESFEPMDLSGSNHSFDSQKSTSATKEPPDKAGSEQEEILFTQSESSCESSSKLSFHCQECDTNYSSKYRLMKHKMAEHGLSRTAQFFCVRCGKGFFTEESLRAHEDTMHGLQMAFVCRFCGKEFLKTSTYKNHMVQIHPDEANPYGCTKCGASFDEVSTLRDHVYNSCEGNRTVLNT